jgi:hypothetical protein
LQASGQSKTQIKVNIMKATINKICSGKYTANHHGYVFMIENQNPNHWTISNQSGVELYADETKTAIVNMISNCSVDRANQLHQQEYCKYA